MKEIYEALIGLLIGGIVVILVLPWLLNLLPKYIDWVNEIFRNL